MIRRYEETKIRDELKGKSKGKSVDVVDAGESLMRVNLL